MLDWYLETATSSHKPGTRGLLNFIVESALSFKKNKKTVWTGPKPLHTFNKVEKV